MPGAPPLLVAGSTDSGIRSGCSDSRRWRSGNRVPVIEGSILGSYLCDFQVSAGRSGQMSTKVLGDAVSLPAAAAADAEESAVCNCCGLTEDCTPGYIAQVRARYGGYWVCGLCAEAVEDDIRRGLVAADEAIRRHAALRRSFRTSDAGEHLIAAVRQLLRRGLGSSSDLRATQSSPRKRTPAPGASTGKSLPLSGGRLPALAR